MMFESQIKQARTKSAYSVKYSRSHEPKPYASRTIRLSEHRFEQRSICIYPHSHSSLMHHHLHLMVTQLPPRDENETVIASLFTTVPSQLGNLQSFTNPPSHHNTPSPNPSQLPPEISIVRGNDGKFHHPRQNSSIGVMKNKLNWGRDHQFLF